MGIGEPVWLAGSCLLKRHIQLPLAKYGQNDYDGRTLEGRHGDLVELCCCFFSHLFDLLVCFLACYASFCCSAAFQADLLCQYLIQCFP